MRISYWSSDVCSSDLLCKLDLQFAKHRPSAPLLPRLLFKGKGRPLNSNREKIGGVEILVRRMLIIGTDQEIDRQIELGLIAQILRELHVTDHIINVDSIDRNQCLLPLRHEAETIKAVERRQFTEIMPLMGGERQL